MSGRLKRSLTTKKIKSANGGAGSYILNKTHEYHPDGLYINNEMLFA